MHLNRYTMNSIRTSSANMQAYSTPDMQGYLSP